MRAAESDVRRSTNALRSDLGELHEKVEHTRELAQWPKQQLQKARAWWSGHLSEEDQWLAPRLGGALAAAFLIQRWRAKRRLARQ
jgi:hypothetical protein